MSQPQSVENPTVLERPNNKKTFTRRFIVLIREIIAILFWGYVITKIFFFDIDIFLVEHFSPSYRWVLDYKFVILVGIIAVILLVTKNKHIVTWSLFILFYPFIFIFWRIPVLIFKKKSWNLLFALIDSIVSFFKSIKLSFISTAIFIVSITVILLTSNNILLWISLVLLLLLHFWAYILKILQVFRPSSIYRVYSKVFNVLSEFVRFKPALASSPAPSPAPGPTMASYVLNEKELEIPIENLDEKQLQKWVTGVQYLVFFNRVCLFVSKKIKAYQDSKFNIFSSIFGILIIVLYTVFVFASINFGLFKINHAYYSFPIEPTFFSFIYYSFNNFVFNTIREIIPASPISQVVSMVESFFALFLGAILISLVLSFRSQRETEELNNVIKYLTEEGIKTEGYLKEKYKINNIEEAMQALRKLNAYFVDLLYKITETIN